MQSPAPIDLHEHRLKAEVRAQLIEVARAWGKQREIDVVELLFRLRTVSLRAREQVEAESK